MAASGGFLRLLCIFSLLVLSEAPLEQEASYSRFTFDASLFPPEVEYDYIVVGGGTAGCPLAATLSEQYRVLLLERGGAPQEFPGLMSQEGFLTTLAETDAYDSPAQAFVSEDGVPNARGRVLGGSSAINAGFYTRADPGFFRKGGGGGAIRWDMGLVNESYEWVEQAVAFRPSLRNWQAAVRDGLLQADVTPYNDFTVLHTVGTKVGASTFDSTGRRHSAADLLAFARQDNIWVALRATVERVLLNPIPPTTEGDSRRKRQRATGVVYRDQFGQLHHAMTRPGGEVILCAGALGSPQLLLLSGIGPRRHLESMGIPVASHKPYVGKSVRDNPRNGISIASPVPLERSLIQVVGITESGVFLEAASNVVPFFSPARFAFLRGAFSPLYVTVATIMEKVAGPLSEGSLRLASLEARDNPAVRFNYFADPADLERCVHGVRKIGDVLAARAMDEFRFPGWPLLGAAGGGDPWRGFRFMGPALPLNRSDDATMEEFCRRTVTTIWHYHGGCVAGRVVDRDLKMFDVLSLRVVDGSVLSASPGTNPQATLMMLGRHTGQRMIMERRRRNGRVGAWLPGAPAAAPPENHGYWS